MADTHAFIIQYTAFLFFMVFVFGIGAPAFITGLPSPPVIPEKPDAPAETWWGKVTATVSNWVGYIVYVVKYVGYYFSLMLVTATGKFSYVGLLVLVPIIIGLIWTVLQIIRGT